ncbi:lasso peptide isopeptide bond-forming cyclase [Calothrix sp. PCC 6303]|uniref:lasso peptide isopeptide bond-forming cyclase n=1 Tax=Calothrix sp. PCC 6303 TaxID=1170562 RepID=UPI0002A00EE3|nr:lasso peptide isopeptide bond-forming cyclase [Calothrix sp. PCC 6303]AFZ00989.1 asparagine synthase [Calothrix sp. PCC 6303]
MSGIMGIHYLDSRPVNQKHLQKMVDILVHRGPDGADIWVDGNVGLAHRMLLTTPESLSEKLPGSNQTGDLVITADARIDNRDEIISKLQLNNCPPENISDSQLILAAYEKWGESCPENLLGDFAFVIWDKRKQSLFCARDHFGVKPFYYYYKPGKIFAFASEIKALFELKQIPRHLNEVRMGDYLSLMMEDQVITSYVEILRLPPAHTIIINQSGLQSRCYWLLEPKPEIKLPSNEAYAEEFRKIFTEAVRCRLRSAFPIITHLSGGLDSSAVTCVARDILSQENKTPLHTISTIYDDIKECDEREYINLVVEQGGLTPHYVYGDKFGPLSNLEMIFKYEDEGLLGPSHFYPWLVNCESQKLGMRISLDGFDGDTTVSHGMTRLTELAHQGKWKTFFHEIKAVSHNCDIPIQDLFRGYGLLNFRKQALHFQWFKFLKAVQQIHENFGTSRKKLIIYYGFKPLISELKQFIKKLIKGRPKQNQNIQNSSSEVSIIRRSFAEKIHLHERIQMMDIPKEQPLTLREEHWHSFSQGIMSYTLEQMDQYAAMFSLEARHPFMDKRLIEFCIALPSEQKLFNGYGRMVMRRALQGILPEQVQWRGGKTDMSTNFDDGLLNRNRQILDDVMSNKIQCLEKYVNVNFLQAAYQRIVSSEKQASNEDIFAVWQAVILTSWMEYKRVTP